MIDEKPSVVLTQMDAASTELAPLLEALRDEIRALSKMDATEVEQRLLANINTLSTRYVDRIALVKRVVTAARHLQDELAALEDHGHPALPTMTIAMDESGAFDQQVSGIMATRAILVPRPEAVGGEVVFGTPEPK